MRSREGRHSSRPARRQCRAGQPARRRVTSVSTRSHWASDTSSLQQRVAWLCAVASMRRRLLHSFTGSCVDAPGKRISSAFPCFSIASCCFGVIISPCVELALQLWAPETPQSLEHSRGRGSFRYRSSTENNSPASAPHRNRSVDSIRGASASRPPAVPYRHRAERRGSPVTTGRPPTA